MPEIKLEGEMLDLAKHIIKTKKGKFDPGKFDDRYESALAELVRAKVEGRPIKARKAPAPAKKYDLLDALRRSASGGGKDQSKSTKLPSRKEKATGAQRSARNTAARRKAS